MTWRLGCGGGRRHCGGVRRCQLSTVPAPGVPAEQAAGLPGARVGPTRHPPGWRRQALDDRAGNRSVHRRSERAPSRARPVAHGARPDRRAAGRARRRDRGRPAGRGRHLDQPRAMVHRRRGRGVARRPQRSQESVYRTTARLPRPTSGMSPPTGCSAAWASSATSKGPVATATTSGYTSGSIPRGTPTHPSSRPSIGRPCACVVAPRPAWWPVNGYWDGCCRLWPPSGSRSSRSTTEYQRPSPSRRPTSWKPSSA